MITKDEAKKHTDLIKYNESVSPVVQIDEEIQKAINNGKYYTIIDYDVMTDEIKKHYTDLGYHVFDDDGGQYSGGGYNISWYE